jgi:DNA-binding NarL/FixJ family response regulator
MPEMNGIEATRQIKKFMPAIDIFIFTMHHTGEMTASAFEAGAQGFVLKSSDEVELVKAIRGIPASALPAGYQT